MFFSGDVVSIPPSEKRSVGDSVARGVATGNSGALFRRAENFALNSSINWSPAFDSLPGLLYRIIFFHSSLYFFILLYSFTSLYSFLVKYICYLFYFMECCAVIIASPSLPQTLPTKLKRIPPLCHILSGERPD